MVRTIAGLDDCLVRSYCPLEVEVESLGVAMYTLYALWSKPSPEDVDAFEEHYQQVHAPLAAKVPDMRRFVTVRPAEGLGGGDPAAYRIAQMSFDSKEALEQAEHSEEWAATTKDAGEMVERFGVSLSVAVGEERTYDLSSTSG